MISFVANNNMYIHVKSALIYIKCLLCVSSLGGPTFISLSCEVSVFIISSHSSKRIPYCDFVIVRKRQCAKVKKQECSHITHIISIKKKSFCIVAVLPCIPKNRKFGQLLYVFLLISMSFQKSKLFSTPNDDNQ